MADRSSDDGRNAERRTAGKELDPPVPARKEVERIDIDVDAGKERVEIASRRCPQERPRDRRVGLISSAPSAAKSHLGPAKRCHRGAGLPVEVGDFEFVEVGDAEGTDAESRQRQEVRAADAA